MPRTFTVNGVPQSIATDAWWLESEVDTTNFGRTAKTNLYDHLSHVGKGLSGLIFLILLGDFLFGMPFPGSR